MKVLRLENIGSTNDYLLGLKTSQEVCAVTDYQSAGKGMGSNTWESEAGKNLLFSILVHPEWLPITEQYLMSMAEALAIHETIVLFLGEEGREVTIKWPNDIYWQDKKLSGTRIDGNIQGSRLQDLIIGTGINVNQEVFTGTAPNPVSMKQITGKTYSRDEILDKMLERFEHYAGVLKSGGKEEIMSAYHARLYRRTGFHRYEDKDGVFEAEIVRVAANGILTLRTKEGEERKYEFKEVKNLL